MAALSDPVPDGLVAILGSPAINERLAAEGWIARGDARRTFERFLSTRVERWLILIGLLLAIATAALSALILVATTSESLDWAEVLAADTGRLEIPTEPVWVLSLLAINVVVGVGSVAAIALIALGRRLRGMTVGFVAVLISIVAGGLVGFYAVQIGALTSTLESLVLLGLIADQRTRLQRAAAEAAETDLAADVDAATD